jgi:TonB family protein
MKKETVLILICVVAILGVFGGYIVGRSHSPGKGTVVTVMRYSELPNVPTVIQRVEPKYPPSALKDKIEGTVGLRVMVGTDGTAMSAEVVKGVQADLDSSAKKAVMLWKFGTLVFRGKPVAGPAIVSIDFKLDTAKSKH